MKPRRWFRFTLATFLILVTLLGSVMGWVGVEVKWIRDRKEALRWMENNRVDLALLEPDYVSARVAPRTLWLFGESPIGHNRPVRIHLPLQNIYSVGEMQRLFPEAEVTRPPPLLGYD